MRTSVTLELPVRSAQSAPTTSTDTPAAAPSPTTSQATPNGPARPPSPRPAPFAPPGPKYWTAERLHADAAPVTGNRAWCEGCHPLNCAGCAVVDGEATPITTCPYCGTSGPAFDESDAPSDYCGHDPALVFPPQPEPQPAIEVTVRTIRPYAWTLAAILARTPDYRPTCLSCASSGLLWHMRVDSFKPGRFKCPCCSRVDDYSEDLELVRMFGSDLNPDHQSVYTNSRPEPAAPVARLTLAERGDRDLRAELMVWDAGDDTQEDPPRYAAWGSFAQIVPALRRFGLDSDEVFGRIGQALLDAGVPHPTITLALMELA